MSGSRWKNEPIDAVLNQAPVRVLRALRWCGWIDVYDFRDVVLDCTHEDNKNAISAALGRLEREGLIEKRPQRQRLGYVAVSDRWCYDLRITPAGRAWLAKKLEPNTETEYAPARPGSEHLLIAEDECA